MKSKEWTVLLVGGSSAVGKSHLTRQLAEYYHIPITEIDDIRISLIQVADPKTYPDLYTFIHNSNILNDFPVEYLVKKLEDVAKVVWLALDVLITKHISYNEKVIFEGDGIVPNLIASRTQDKIKTIFLYDEKKNIEEREIKRNRGLTSIETSDKQAELSFQFGELIKKQAESLGYITVKASPIKTLFQRTIKLLEK